MAGLGKRFSDDGFMRPKPLIEINNVPMIQKAIESIGIDGRYIFITRKTEHSKDSICRFPAREHSTKS